MLYRTGFTQLDRSDSIRCGNGTVSYPFANPADRKPLWQFPNQLSIEVNPQIVKIVEQYHDWLLQTLSKCSFGQLQNNHSARKAMWYQQLINVKTVHIGAGVHYRRIIRN